MIRVADRLWDRAAALALPAAAAVALAAAITPAPRIPKPVAGRWVTDLRGQRVGVPVPFVRAAEIVPPSVSEYLVATGRPGTLRLAQTFNRAPLRSGLVGRMFPAAVETVAFFQGAPDQGPGLEQMLRLQPSAVLARRPAAADLERLGLPTIVLANTQTAADIERHAAILAAAVGSAPRESVLAQRAATRMAEVTTELNGLPSASRPRVLVMYRQSSGRLIGFGPATLPTRLVAAAGGVDPLPARAVAVALDPERLLRLNPDVILIMNTTPASTAPAALMADPVFAALNAVRSRRVYRVAPGIEFFPGDLVDYPLFVRWTAEVLHPGLPARVRKEMRYAYAGDLGYAMSDADLDAALALRENAGSAGYGRFSR